MLRVCRLLVGCISLVAWFAESEPAVAQPEVWSGFDFAFTKPNDVNPTLPENQDRITGNVWLTRDVQSGLFNFHDESAYSPSSPAGTEWATYINNSGETIAATNFAELTFAPWIDAYGGMGGMNLPQRLLGGDAVLHLIADDVYLDIQFTGWTSNALGGGFAYNRAAAPPTTSPTGDYNGNDVVDAADYVLWRDTLTQPAVPPGSGADGDESGAIDAPDYEFWRANFGNVVAGAGGGQALAVPEPAALLLAFSGLFFLWLGVRRGSKLRCSD